MRTTRFSKKCFFDALLRLYHRKPYSEIQISEICRAAGYNRSTFYRVYPSKEALLLEGFQEEYVNGYYQTIPPATSDPQADYERNVRLLFAFIRENHDFFLMMRDAHLLSEMYLLFREAFPYDKSLDANGVFVRDFLAAGYLAVLYEWLDGGMKQTDQEMAYKITNIVSRLSVD